MTMDQFLGLYNYWIVIFLMMTGFYIVIARENLIKTVIGLNIFQTSVFLLYITMGKVTDGTAPIIQNPVEHHGEHHGEDHGEHAAEHAAEIGVTNVQALSGGADSVSVTSTTTNETLDQRIEAVVPASFEEDLPGRAVDATSHGLETAGHGLDAAGHALETVGHTDEIYSNPLPSVLMLTAIVVGIATTALALALIVRIREEYGTIEESEILELDRNS